MAASATYCLDDEWDQLATALNRLGVLHVAPQRRRRSGVPRTATELFDRLQRSADPRLRQAAVVLLLTRPALAADALDAIEGLTGSVRDRAQRMYVAATAMQRMARTRIRQQLGDQPDLPPRFLDNLGLPPLNVDHGRETLIELARQEREQHGYDAWGSYRALLDLFLAESRRTGWRSPCASVPTVPA